MYFRDTEKIRLQEETGDSLGPAENADTTMNMDAEDGQVFEHEPQVLPEETLKNDQAQPVAPELNPPSAPSLSSLPQNLVGMSGMLPARCSFHL